MAISMDHLLRPSRKDEGRRHGEPLLKAVRQLIESVIDTLKGQLDLQAHGGRTFEGVAIRVARASWPWLTRAASRWTIMAGIDILISICSSSAIRRIEGQDHEKG
jgi:hypothetical protein